MISKLKVTMKLKPGIFENHTLKTLATAINMLIEKSNEQTEIINQLVKENEELKSNIKKSVEPNY